MSIPEFPSFKRPWWGVFVLTFCAFVFNTTEFVPVGLLGAIGHSLHMQPTDVGLMLTIYAWTVAVASIPLTLLTRHVERRKLLVCILALFIASHLVAGIAWNFPVLVIGRIGIAFAHAIFWSISVSLVVRLVPPQAKRRALGMLAIGTSVAMVLGIPLGRVIGETLGWRVTFLVIAVAAVLTLVMLWVTLPELPSERTGSLKSLPGLLKNPLLMLLYGVTIFTVAAHFTAYTYLELFLHDVTHASGNRITYVLLLFGSAGIPAAFLFNRFYATRPKEFLLTSVIVLSVCLLVLFPCALTIVTLSAHTLVWGAAIICFGLAMQAQVLELAPDATDLAISLYSGLYNVGIGAGALLGNHISHQLGISWVATFGGTIGVLGAGLSWLALRIAPRRMTA